jgi:hypothetical protein
MSEPLLRGNSKSQAPNTKKIPRTEIQNSKRRKSRCLRFEPLTFGDLNLFQISIFDFPWYLVLGIWNLELTACA